MIGAELYISGQRVDTYEDVNIVIKDSVKDAKDVGKVFTAFSQEFRLPASKANNKIFKHFYNAKITNGFDARRKYDAIIKVNGANYQYGYIKLNGVDLKDNKAESYRVQFFGELTSLKDKLGEDILPDLETLNKYNHRYDIDTVRDGFETSLKYTAGSGMVAATSATTKGEVIYPMLSHTRGFTYSTTDGMYDLTQTGTITGADRLNYTDLKPALKCSAIIDAIEDKYDIRIRGDFFNSLSKPGSPFDDMYLWLHREKGDVKAGGDSNQLNFLRVISDGTDENEYALDSGTDMRPLTYWNDDYTLTNQYYECEFEVVPTGTGEYNIRVDVIASTGEVRTYYQQNNSGTQTFSFTVPEFPLGQDVSASDPWTYRVETRVIADSGITSIVPTLSVQRYITNTAGLTGVYGNSSVSLFRDVLITENLPKMKVIDFLSSFFKMFNLVCYALPQSASSQTLDIYATPLNSYYLNGGVWDITNWVDVSTSSVERVSPYNVLRFEYPDPKTLLAIKANEKEDYDFGNNVFLTSALGGGDNTLLFDGGSYEVNPSFEKMMYERMIDIDDDSATEIQWGWFVNDFSENTPEPELGSPLVFFRHNRTLSSDSILWSDSTSTTTTYNAPSNVMDDLSQTLHFGAEFDEYTYNVNENSLFKNYYQDQIETIYDKNTRRVRVQAVLPPLFIFNYTLADTIIIANVAYYIDNIEINLLTGRSNLELIRVRSVDGVFIKTPEQVSCYIEDEYIEDGYFWCDAYDKPGITTGTAFYFMDGTNVAFVTSLTITEDNIEFVN